MLPTVIENLLRKSDDRFTFQFTQRQTSIILTAMQLIRFEILAKSDHKEAKNTLDVLQEIITMLDSKMKLKQRGKQPR